MVKCLEKGNNYLFEVPQQKSKVQFMNLAFKNLKIGSEKPQQYLEN